MTFEVEQKFHVEDRDRLESRLRDLGATLGPVERHRDTYYNHPCRDFSQTREALRIRRLDGAPFVTYKGPKLPGTVKARRELEWALSPGDSDGSRTEELWQHLGFRKVATVCKSRWPYQMSGELSDFAVVIDEVDGLGTFAEVERVVEGPPQIDPARQQILELADRLGLSGPESRSYLRMFLEVDRPE